jgi:Fic family protein
MFRPQFQRTDSLIATIARIAVARDRILRAPIVPRWEAALRREALVRSAHHSTSIEGNPLSLEEVTDLLSGRDVLAHPRDRQEVLNYAEVLRYIDRDFRDQKRQVTEETILRLHALVVKDVLPPAETGQYRRVPVVVGIPSTGEVIYRPLYQRDDCPLDKGLVPSFEALFYEPFYQFMRQPLLAHEMERAHELGADRVSSRRRK